LIHSVSSLISSSPENRNRKPASVCSHRVKSKAGLRRPSISPSPNTRESEHTQTEARTYAATAYSILAIIGPLSVLAWNHEKGSEQK
jgi:hypothetical protein